MIKIWIAIILVFFCTPLVWKGVIFMMGEWKDMLNDLVDEIKSIYQ